MHGRNDLIRVLMGWLMKQMKQQERHNIIHNTPSARSNTQVISTQIPTQQHSGPQNQNNRTKYIFFNLRKMDNRNKWKN